jgi:hypothetical protein
MIVDKTLIVYVGKGEKEEFLNSIHNVHVSILSDTAFRIDFSSSRDSELLNSCEEIFRFNKCGLSRKGNLRYNFKDNEERAEKLNKLIRKVLWK